MSQRPVATKMQSPELKRLAVIVDEWSEESRSFESAACPTAKVTAVETFEWLPDELWLLHNNASTDYTDYADSQTNTSKLMQRPQL